MDYMTSSSKLLTVPDLSGGVNYHEEPHKIQDNQLSDLGNMEFEDGVLRRRSGYEKLIAREDFGEVLSVDEFDGKLYFACTNALLSVDMETDKISVLVGGLNLNKPGSFFFQGDFLYYFSGDGIYKFGKNLSDFYLKKLNVDVPVVTCELEENIFTDGNKVYDFSGLEANIYDVNSVETLSFNHMCRYGDIVYGVNKDNPLNGEVRIIGIKYEKLTAEDGTTFYSTVGYEVEDTVSFPFHESRTAIDNMGNYIRWMSAVKGYLIFQCDVLPWSNEKTDGVRNPYCGYCPAVITYNLETGAVESQSVPFTKNQNYIYELCAVWDDTVFTLREERDNDTYLTLTVKNYDTGQNRTIRCGYMSIADDDSTTYQKTSLTYLAAVAEDLLVLTYRTSGNNYATKLFQVLDSSIYELDSATSLIRFLKKIGSNYYNLPVEPSFFDLIGLNIDRMVVTPYRFSKDGIQTGYEYISETPLHYTGYDFVRHMDECFRLSSAEFSAIKVEGYVPVILNAMFTTSSGEYQTVPVEQYNLLSRYAKVRFVEAVSPTVLSLELPISFNTVEDITSTRNELITFSKSGENTKVTSTKPFEIGEELLILSANTGNQTGPEKCHLAIPYGGTSYTEGSGTRLFVAGDPANGNTYYYSDVNNFEFFPELNFDILDSSAAPITGFAKHYQDLIVFKSDSIAKLSYLYEEGQVVFPVVNLHDSIGCDMPGSIQMVNNDVVFGNSEKGLYLLSIQDVSSERNLHPISIHINGKKGLMKYSPAERRNAKSFDFKNRYYLAAGGDVYVWNYEQTPFQGYQEQLAWYVWRDISVSAFCAAGEYLAFAPQGAFALYAFNGAQDDNGAPIQAYFTTKAFDYGDANALKTVWQFWMNVTCQENMPLTLTGINERGQCLGHRLGFCANRFFGSTVTRRLKHKRVLYLGFRVENSGAGPAFDVSDIKIEYETYKSRR